MSADYEDDPQLKVLDAVMESRDWPDWLVAIDADLEEGIVTVTVTDREAADVDDVFTVDIDGDTRDFAIRVEEGPPAHFLMFGQAPMPVPPGGPTIGGDPIWNRENGWGTLALASPQIKVKDHTGAETVVPNAMLGCNHVLAMLDLAQDGDAIGLYKSPGSATLGYVWPVTNTGLDPIDVALAELAGAADVAMREVRGLGPVTGVAAPNDRERLFKCGARTSITTALDNKYGTVTVPGYANRKVKLRKTSPDFADVGDSGAAVLNEARQLVGIVILGRQMPNGDHITYYLPTLPWGTPTKPNALFLELEI